MQVRLENEEENDMTKIEMLTIPLPDDVLKLKTAGYLKDALEMIDQMLLGFLPNCMKERLELEKEIIHVLGISQYPYTKEQAITIMKEFIEDFQEEEMDFLQKSSAADWMYLDGVVHFHNLFFENIIKTRPQYKARLKQIDGTEKKDVRLEKLIENVAYMKEHGGRKTRVTIRASVKVKKEAERVGESVLVHLPIPQACRQISDIQILKTSHTPELVVAEDAKQRTISYCTKLKEDETFFVEYSYLNQLTYVEPLPSAVLEVQENLEPEFLVEQAPHIMFTPFLKTLLEEIIGDETNPLVKARLIYDFITTKVMYSFVRAYVTLDNIAEYAAKNLKGDCGVQAILFITLCRMTGIPARWQSGLHAMDVFTGCHDWAEFYVEPYGWMYADPSFGGSAYRMGHLERWNYYFGNLDVYRMVANSEMQTQFDPPKQFLKADPIDNQRGEIEYEDRTLLLTEYEADQVTLSMVDL